MKPIDMLGFGPKREETKLPEGGWRITVTPPTWSGFKGSSIDLTADQYICGTSNGAIPEC